jgi:hypothetical protein
MTAYMLGRVFGVLGSSLLLVAAFFWLFKRGRISFRDAVLNPWVVLAGLALAAVNFTVGLAPDGGVLGKGLRTAIRNGCVSSAVARMDGTAAGETCDCMIKEIENTFTRESFKALSASMEKNGVVSPEMGAIAAKCEPKGK